MKFRILEPTDVDALRDLLAVFGDAFEDPDTYTAQQPDDAWLRGLLVSDAFIAIAAFDGDRVVGGLAGYVLPKFEQPRREFYIYDLAVAPTHRRRGIADGLIDTLKAEAGARGIYVIFVQADAGDAPAANLYAKHGVRERVLHFDIAPAHPNTLPRRG